MGMCKGDTEPLVVGSFSRNYFDRDYLIQQQLLEVTLTDIIKKGLKKRFF